MVLGSDMSFKIFSGGKLKLLPAATQSFYYEPAFPPQRLVPLVRAGVARGGNRQDSKLWIFRLSG